VPVEMDLFAEIWSTTGAPMYPVAVVQQQKRFCGGNFIL